jgi:uncharacterized protein YukE
MISGPPSNYDNVTISVDCDFINSMASEIQNYVADIGAQLSTINNTTSNLQLSWAGKTQQEAKDFCDQLTTVMENLFGKNGDIRSESASVISRIADGLQIAASNYGAAEESIIQLFSVADGSYRTAYSKGQQDAQAHKDNPNLKYDGQTYGDSSTWSDVQDPTETSVSEVF